MSLEVQTYAVLACTFALYFVVPIWLLVKGWPLRAGLAGLLIALLPGIAHGVFWPDSAGNFGLLMIVLVPLPLLLMATGVVAGFSRLAKKATSERA